MARGTKLPGGSGQRLQSIDLLAKVPLPELEVLARRGAWTRYPAERQILNHLDQSTDVSLIVDGTVRVILFSASGREVTFRDIAAGGHFGELAAIDCGPRSATIIAMEDSLICALSREMFWKVVCEHPTVAEKLLIDLTHLVRSLTERVFEFSTLAVRNRVHAELLRLARGAAAGGNTAVIRPAPTHADMASRISTGRETVTRELGQLAREGLIERQGASLVVHDVARLERMVHDVIGY